MTMKWLTSSTTSETPGVIMGRLPALMRSARYERLLLKGLNDHIYLHIKERVRERTGNSSSSTARHMPSDELCAAARVNLTTGRLQDYLIGRNEASCMRSHQIYS